MVTHTTSHLGSHTRNEAKIRLLFVVDDCHKKIVNRQFDIFRILFDIFINLVPSFDLVYLDYSSNKIVKSEDEKPAKCDNNGDTVRHHSGRH